MAIPQEVTSISRPSTAARLVVDSRGQIREATPSAHRLLGYAEGTLVGLALVWITPPSQHALVRTLHDTSQRNKRRALHTVMLDHRGNLLPVSLSTEPCTTKRGQELSLTLELQSAQARSRSPAERTTVESATCEHLDRGAITEQLDTCMDLLRWLDTQLDKADAPKASRDRALARVVLHEASGLLEQCRSSLSTVLAVPVSNENAPLSSHDDP